MEPQQIQSCMVDIIDREAQTWQLLDERLLKIPPFSSLRKGPSPQLAYNLLDILYSIAWTLRLYHGLHNATSHAPVEAVETLLSSSHVLSQDARYTTLEEVLGASTTLSTQLFHHSSGGCNTHWTVLTQDVAFLAQFNRHVARALLEAIDILRSALAQFQKQQHQKQKQQSLTNDEVMEQKTTVVKWKQSKKKLEFYLSWSWEHADLYELGERIYSWMETRPCRVHIIPLVDHHRRPGHEPNGTVDIACYVSLLLAPWPLDVTWMLRGPYKTLRYMPKDYHEMSRPPLTAR